MQYYIRGKIRQVYPRKNVLSPISLKVREIIILLYSHADTQLTLTSTKVIEINFFMEVLETCFHQLYAESNGFR